jgi:hypothetical protein
MRHASLTLALILILSIISVCQENEYTVLTKSGDVFLLHKISKEPIEIFVGDKLKPYERVELGSNGYLVLVDTNFRSIELSEKGIYNMSSIDSLFTMKRNSITEKITEFIFNEMSTNEEKNNEMKTLGAVVRKPFGKVEASVPKYGKILDTLYTFSWYPLLSTSSYIFRLFNDDGNTLYMKETKDTSLTLNLSEINLLYDKNYFWTVFDVSSEKQDFDSVSFTLMNPNSKAVLEDKIMSMKNDFILTKSPMNYLIIARYLKSEGVNELALEYLEKSVELSPKLEFYWGEYLRYLLELDLKNKAFAKWNISPFNNSLNEIEN